jgi:hypothetical protein
MNHDDAMEMMAAERYILGELEPAERDAFEEHYFECSVCADDVRDSAKFAAGVRTSDAWVKQRTAARFNWWATAAASVFAAALGYQSLIVIPQMAEKRDAHAQSARVLMQPQQLNSESRGPSVAVVLARPDEPVLLAIPFTATTQGPHRGEIHDSRGKQVGDAFDVPETGELVPLFVPAGTLHSGNYTLVIRGAGGQEDSRYRFEVRSR